MEEEERKGHPAGCWSWGLRPSVDAVGLSAARFPATRISKIVATQLRSNPQDNIPAQSAVEAIASTQTRNVDSILRAGFNRTGDLEARSRHHLVAHLSRCRARETPISTRPAGHRPPDMHALSSSIARKHSKLRSFDSLQLDSLSTL